MSIIRELSLRNIDILQTFGMTPPNMRQSELEPSAEVQIRQQYEPSAAQSNSPGIKFLNMLSGLKINHLL